MDGCRDCLNLSAYRWTCFCSIWCVSFYTHIVTLTIFQSSQCIGWCLGFSNQLHITVTFSKINIISFCCKCIHRACIRLFPSDTCTVFSHGCLLKIPQWHIIICILCCLYLFRSGSCYSSDTSCCQNHCRKKHHTKFFSFFYHVFPPLPCVVVLGSELFLKLTQWVIRDFSVPCTLKITKTFEIRSFFYKNGCFLMFLRSP